jgi:hypothetical protein
MDQWIGVDLDGTLAYYEKWDNGKIGKPINRMMFRVKQWLGAGKTVKIMTARADDESEVRKIKLWLKSNGLPELDVTNKKDFGMIELWDDRAVQVEKNTGRRIGG